MSLNYYPDSVSTGQMFHLMGEDFKHLTQNPGTKLKPRGTHFLSLNIMNIFKHPHKYIITIIFFAVLTMFASCGGGSGFKRVGKRVIVLGIDGMDPKLLSNFMARGVMPNFSRLAAEGSFVELTTSIPPQSPVAWSNFITGMDPGGHGIYDFIHRRPDSRIPYLSTSGMTPPSKIVKLGKYRIPLKGGEAVLLRKGKAFWQILEENGIPSALFKIPANFPPAETEARTFSGMGTPDILGSYGIFTFFTDDSSLYQGDIAGGKVTMAQIDNGKVETVIEGPANSLIEGEPTVTAPVILYIDSNENSARIIAGESDFILQPGEWSGWVKLKFEILKPFASTSGMVRFYLRRVSPHLELYCSPVNLDPADPALPISTPPDYAGELYRNLGRFYTLGIPEDTKALSAGYLTYDEFIQQAKLVLAERLREFDYTWRHFDDGFYLFYFSTLDQNSHCLWSTFDREHPLYQTELEDKYGWQLMEFYIEIDRVLGRTLDEMHPEDLLLIMSDHGFAPFRYCFDLNTWLLENGYITLRDTSKREQEFFPGVDWRRTEAYGLGINSLYLNLRGREQNGAVQQVKAEELKDELIDKLTSAVDPRTGLHPISSVWKREEIYHGAEVTNAPDLIIGYNTGYRASWDTVLGKFPHHIYSDNLDKWSGDHCVDNQWVPGVLLSNRKIDKENPALYDLTATILAEFGIEIPDYMAGESIFNRN